MALACVSLMKTNPPQSLSSTRCYRTGRQAQGSSLLPLAVRTPRVRDRSPMAILLLLSKLVYILSEVCAAMEHKEVNVWTIQILKQRCTVVVVIINNTRMTVENYQSRVQR